LRLGLPHPDYLFPLLTAKQWLDWQQFDAEHGLGIDREDIQWGMLMSMFYNVNRSGGAFKTAEDFMPYRTPEEQSDEDFLASLHHTLASIPTRT